MRSRALRDQIDPLMLIASRTGARLDFHAFPALFAKLDQGTLDETDKDHLLTLFAQIEHVIKAWANG